MRLALFAEMLKRKPWTPATLREVGGTQGVGLTFLEEQFSAQTAPPEHRHHQQAAQALLKALLPDSGTDFKGQMRSRQELLDASGYADRPKDFDDLIHILDPELRLITPTEPEGPSIEGQSTTQSGQYYQLTHDYLVHSLRDWLSRKQRETRRGRAELRLDERATLWGQRREPKQLPTIREWLTIALLVPRHRWSQPQRDVMKAAGRRHLVRAACVFGLGAVTLLAAGMGYGRYYAQNLVERLLVAETSRVPETVAKLGPYRQWANRGLCAASNDPSRSSRERLHARLALLPAGIVKPESLIEPLLIAPPEDFRAILSMLSPYGARLGDSLWTCVAAADEQGAPDPGRVRARSSRPR